MLVLEPRWRVTREEVEWWGKKEGLLVLSIEELLKRGSRLEPFREMVTRYRDWVAELFDRLQSGWA
jgi:hypothetical protein